MREKEARPMPLLDPQMAEKITTLQSLDDAIAFRLDTLNQPCPECAPAGRCAQHDNDVHLIASYQNRHAAAYRDALTGLDPADIATIMQPGDDPPTTAAVLSIAVMARLRELAADGPVMTHLDGQPVVIELDGQVIIEHPLTPTGHATP